MAASAVAGSAWPLTGGGTSRASTGSGAIPASACAPNPASSRFSRSGSVQEVLVLKLALVPGTRVLQVRTCMEIVPVLVRFLMQDLAQKCP